MSAPTLTFKRSASSDKLALALLGGAAGLTLSPVPVMAQTSPAQQLSQGATTLQTISDALIPIAIGVVLFGAAQMVFRKISGKM